MGICSPFKLIAVIPNSPFAAVVVVVVVVVVLLLVTLETLDCDDVGLTCCELIAVIEEEDEAGESCW